MQRVLVAAIVICVAVVSANYCDRCSAHNDSGIADHTLNGCVHLDIRATDDVHIASKVFRPFHGVRITRPNADTQHVIVVDGDTTLPDHFFATNVAFISAHAGEYAMLHADNTASAIFVGCTFVGVSIDVRTARTAIIVNNTFTGYNDGRPGFDYVHWDVAIYTSDCGATITDNTCTNFGVCIRFGTKWWF